jgi:hypothetical protein
MKEDRLERSWFPERRHAYHGCQDDIPEAALPIKWQLPTKSEFCPQNIHDFRYSGDGKHGCPGVSLIPTGLPRGWGRFVGSFALGAQANQVSERNRRRGGP